MLLFCLIHVLVDIHMKLSLSKTTVQMGHMKLQLSLKYAETTRRKLMCSVFLVQTRSSFINVQVSRDSGLLIWMVCHFAVVILSS